MFQRRKSVALLLSIAFVAGADCPLPSQNSEVDWVAVRYQAEQGNVSAQLELAKAYYQGVWATHDYKMAYNWALKAALSGNSEAETLLGEMYDDGRGVDSDKFTAFQWYLKAASQGNLAAESAVGDKYANADGVQGDLAQAAGWYKKAAEGGDVHAESRLGLAYLYGRGIDKDEATGLAYLIKGQADPVASLEVAKCYQNGIFVQSDLLRAYAWSLVSLHYGKTADALNLKSSLEQRLTDEQREIGESLMQQCLQITQTGSMQRADLSVGLENERPVSIPFEFLCNYILISARINGHEPEVFLLDTGSSTSSIDPEYAAKIEIVGSDYYPVVGIGRGLQLSRMSQPSDIFLSGLQIKAVQFALYSAQVGAALGRPIVGVLGSDILRSLQLNIDFERKVITFAKPISDQASSRPDATLPIIFHFGLPYVKGTVANDGYHSDRRTFLVDTGDPEAISLSRDFQDKNARLHFKPFSSSGAAGVGGSEQNNRAFCQAMLFDDCTIDAPLVGLIRSGGQAYSVEGGGIGNEIWRRFNITLDYPHSKLILYKNSHYHDAYEYALAGMLILSSGPNYKTLTVCALIPDGAGAKSGFQIGDKIVSVDELGSGRFTMAAIRHLLSTEGTSHFQITRNGEKMSLQLSLKCWRPETN